MRTGACVARQAMHHTFCSVEAVVVRLVGCYGNHQTLQARGCCVPNLSPSNSSERAVTTSCTRRELKLSSPDNPCPEELWIPEECQTSERLRSMSLFDYCNMVRPLTWMT